MKTLEICSCRLVTLLVLLALGGCAGGGGVEAPSPEASAHRAVLTITAEDVAREIGVLAHDSMAGRDTPSPGLEAAASHIADRFRSMGLEPAGESGTYRDRFEWERSRLLESETTVRIQGAGSAEHEWGTDFLIVPGRGGRASSGSRSP
jgi:hypothetical protein